MYGCKALAFCKRACYSNGKVASVFHVSQGCVCAYLPMQLIPLAGTMTIKSLHIVRVVKDAAYSSCGDDDGVALFSFSKVFAMQLIPLAGTMTTGYRSL